MCFFITVLVEKMLTQDEIDRMSDQEVAVWYNGNVIYPDKVWLNWLLLSALFFCEGYSDDFVYGAGEEDGVCGGGDLTKTKNK